MHYIYKKLISIFTGSRVFLKKENALTPTWELGPPTNIVTMSKKDHIIKLENVIVEEGLNFTI